jgi:hypothetical protein
VAKVTRYRNIFVLLLFLATIQLEVFAQSQSLPKELIGRWQLNKSLYTTQATDIPQFVINKLLASELDVSPQAITASAYGWLRFKGHERYAITDIQTIQITSQEQLYEQFYETYEDLGIQTKDKVEYLSLSLERDPDWKPFDGYPGEQILLVNSNRLIIKWNGNYINAVKMKSKSNGK